MKNNPNFDKPAIVEKNRFINKGFIIGFLVTFAIDLLIGLAIVFFEVYGSGRDFETEGLIVLCDAFAIPGALTCLYYLLCFVSDEGAFDIISYSVQLAWHMTFHRNVRETNLPASYTEYRQMKRAKPKSSLSFILFSGLLFLIIGIILSLIRNFN